MRRSFRHLISNQDFRELLIFLFFVLVAFGFWYMQKVSDQKSPIAETPMETNDDNVTMSNMSLDVPIRGINLPAKTQLKTFPSKTKVSFLVDLKRIREVKVSDFDVVVDYTTLPDNAAKADLNLTKSPSFVRHLELTPTSVEILIEKR